MIPAWVRVSDGARARIPAWVRDHVKVVIELGLAL